MAETFFNLVQVQQDIITILNEYMKEFEENISPAYASVGASMDSISLEFYIEENMGFEDEIDLAYEVFTKYQTKIIQFLNIIFPNANMSYDCNNGYVPDKLYRNPRCIFTGRLLSIKNIPIRFHKVFELETYNNTTINRSEK